METALTAAEELEPLERRLMSVRKLVKDLRSRDRDDDTWLQLHVVELHEMVSHLQARVIDITGSEIFLRFRAQHD